MDAEELVAGRYRLLEELGAGGVGTVRRARDTLLNRDVAIKEIRFPPQVTEVERVQLTEKAIAEASAAARLNHPKIITVYDVVEHAARPWIVMQLVVGQSLERLIAVEGRLAPDAVALLGMELLDALEAAHAAGIVHRDVKPSNVLLPTSGGLLLTDFSIAKVLGSDTNTLHGVLTGSPGYMAPERFVDGITGPEADLFGLGATLYHAVEGRPPFDFENLMAGLFATATKPHPVPEHAGELLPVIDGLLAKDAAQRLTVDRARELLAPLARQGGLTDAASAGPSGVVSGLAAKGAIVPVWEIDAPEPMNAATDTKGVPLWAPLTSGDEPDPPLLDPYAPPAELPESADGLARSRRLRIAGVLVGAVVLALAAMVTAQAMSGDDPTDDPLAVESIRPSADVIPVLIVPSPSETPQPTDSPTATTSPDRSPAASPSSSPSRQPSASPSPSPPAPPPTVGPIDLTSNGNGTWTGLVTLSGPAPESTTYTLQYTGIDLTGLPTTVTVLEGETTGTFNVSYTPPSPSPADAPTVEVVGFPGSRTTFV